MLYKFKETIKKRFEFNALIMRLRNEKNLRTRKITEWSIISLNLSNVLLEHCPNILHRFHYIIEAKYRISLAAFPIIFEMNVLMFYEVSALCKSQSSSSSKF